MLIRGKVGTKDGEQKRRMERGGGGGWWSGDSEGGLRKLTGTIVSKARKNTTKK